MNGLTRRAFLAGSGVAAGSLVLGCQSGSAQAWGAERAAAPDLFDAWLAITPEGRILVQAHKVEMGQGTYTAFATLVGEELRIDPSRVELVAAPVHSEFGAPMQGTGGSSSLKEIWLPLRETGARAREMLRAAAAERWEVDAASLTVEDGRVVDPEHGRSLSYGELARDAARRRAPRSPALTPPEQWRYIGQGLPRVDGPEKVDGSARYGMDVQLPGMHTAVVAHCPHPRGRLLRYDDTSARAVSGVVDVFEIEGGIAIVAEHYWSARQAAKQLEVEWDPGESRGVDSMAVRAGLARALDAGSLHTVRDEGDPTARIEASKRRIEAEYALPYLAHATMEPMNCTVAPREGGADVYCGSQAPGLVQDAVAHQLGLARNEVLVHNQLLGGGFGRRFFTDMAKEAAQIARRSDAPVKLVWSREDDMARDFYRPASLHRLRAGLAEDGRPSGWEHRLAAPSLIPDIVPSVSGAFGPQWMRGAIVSMSEGLAQRIPGWFGPPLAVEGANHPPYAGTDIRVEAVAWDPGIPAGIWRSVGHSHNGFVVESFVDELAHAAGQDPAGYRRALFGDHPRHLAVLDRLVEASGWGRAGEGRGQGIAVHESFGTVVGQVAEVSVEGDALRVHRVVCVVDCGLAVNPDIVASQMESGILYGLTAALHGAIHFEDGAAVESNFHDHRMLRLAETPEIEVVILPSADPPSGVGEPGTPPIAPAVANAIFAATGRRLRELPLLPLQHS